MLVFCIDALSHVVSSSHNIMTNRKGTKRQINVWHKKTAH